MQFQKQLFGEPDKKVFDQERLVTRFVRDIGHSVFDSRTKNWMLALEEKIARGKGTKMGLEEDLTLDQYGPDVWLVEALIQNSAQFIGIDLMNNRAIEIIEVKDTMIVIRGFGLTWTGEKKLVWFNEETEKWEVGIA